MRTLPENADQEAFENWRRQTSEILARLRAETAARRRGPKRNQALDDLVAGLADLLCTHTGQRLTRSQKFFPGRFNSYEFVRTVCDIAGGPHIRGVDEAIKRWVKEQRKRRRQS
jgi:hypothetical protein